MARLSVEHLTRVVDWLRNDPATSLMVRRSDVRALIAEIDALQTERDALREALGRMLDHSPAEHWTGRADWREQCRRVYEETTP